MKRTTLLLWGCGLLAGLLAWLLFDGITMRFSMGAFRLTVDASALSHGLLAGLLVGLIGAIPPAIHCLRLPIPEALTWL